jgi:hypothetical protein
MPATLSPERYDPDFRGQALATTYFDTRDFTLAKARRRKDRYVTLRLRCYDPAHVYAFSVKTESQKFRQVIDPDEAEGYLAEGVPTHSWPNLLPADLVARLYELVEFDRLEPVVTLRARRYAVEDEVDRLTLDVDVRSDTGKVYPSSVMEYKSTLANAVSPLRYQLRPIKLSKFLWGVSTP